MKYSQKTLHSSPERARYGVSFVSSKGNIFCRLIKIELYKIFAIINRAIRGLHCMYFFIITLSALINNYLSARWKLIFYNSKTQYVVPVFKMKSSKDSSLAHQTMYMYVPPSWHETPIIIVILVRVSLDSAKSFSAFLLHNSDQFVSPRWHWLDERCLLSSKRKCKLLKVIAVEQD